MDVAFFPFLVVKSVLRCLRTIFRCSFWDELWTVVQAALLRPFVKSLTILRAAAVSCCCNERCYQSRLEKQMGLGWGQSPSRTVEFSHQLICSNSWLNLSNPTDWRTFLNPRDVAVATLVLILRCAQIGWFLYRYRCTMWPCSGWLVAPSRTLSAKHGHERRWCWCCCFCCCGVMKQNQSVLPHSWTPGQITPSTCSLEDSTEMQWCTFLRGRDAF